MKQITFADKLIKGIDSARTRANKDKRSTAEYWNGDDWGSCSGIKDADDWVNNQINTWVVKFLKNNSAE